MERLSAPRFAIIGCGLIGKKRLAALPVGQCRLFCDIDLARAQALAAQVPGSRALADPHQAVCAAEIDAVIIATDNASLFKLAREALVANKHVLIEKPGAIRSRDLDELHALAQANGRLLRIGYNHRFHPAFRQARTIVDAGLLGPLMFIRARYGHGGRVGYEKEWRADPSRSGGGELIDQGVHLLDLSRWFLGDIAHAEGMAGTFFWNMPVDDNAFVLTRTAEGRTAWLHASCSEWKNLFSFEIYGRQGKLHIEGLGGSYGVERLYHYKMLPEMGPPDTQIFEYPRGDESWALETRAFIEDLIEGRDRGPNAHDGAQILRVVEQIYARSAELPAFAGREQL